MNHRHSIIGGAFAFILGTACCWLPALVVLLGGASGLLALSESLEQYSGLFMLLGIGLIGYGGFKLYQKKRIPAESGKVILQSTLTCPVCGFKKEETMPTDACQFFYQCESCKTNLKPLPGDCCVYCSYGTVACPPIQMEKDCC